MVFDTQKSRSISGLVLGLILLLFFSCTTKQQNADVQEITEHAFGLLNNGDVKKAISYIDSGYNAQHKLTTLDLWRKYQFKCNYYIYYELNTGKASMYADSMLTILKGKQTQYPNQYAETLFYRGDVLKSEQKLNSAFSQYYEARKFVQEHLDACDVASYTNRLGLIKYSQQQYKSAIPYLKKALTENASCGNNRSFDANMILPQSIYNTIGLCQEKMGQLDSAKSYYFKGLELIKSRENRFKNDTAFISSARGVFYGNLGGVYLKLGDGANAETYLRKSIAINDRWGYARIDAQFTKLKLANYLLKFNKFDKLETLIADLEKSMAELEGSNLYNDALKLNFNKLIRDYYRVKKENTLANLYEQKYILLADSLNKSEKLLKQVDMEEHFRETEQVYRLKLLDRDNHLKTLYIISILIFSLMAIGLLIAVWKNLKRSRKNIVQLTSLNNQIVEQNIAMQQTLNALEQSQKENTGLMGIVAHDLRNPLSSMILAVSLMKEDNNRKADDLKLLGMMETSLRNSMDLINDLLVTHSDSETLTKEPLDLAVLLNYCTELLRPKAAEKGQEITLLASKVILDLSREKMWRVFSNLIGNAVKFSDAGTTIAVEVSILLEKVRVTVADHGIGIEPAMQDKIFEMLTPAKRIGTAGEQPYGMGLSIAKQIVEAHGGKIWFESNNGRGTVFIVDLPI